MKASEILIRGKQNIVDHGWAQGDYIVTDDASTKVCGVCTLGACRLALIGEEPTPKLSVYIDSILFHDDYAAYSDVVDLLESVVTDTYEGRYYDIPGWNDDTDRTLDEVLSVFDAAIAAAKRNEE